jgi:hypothetical protein
MPHLPPVTIRGGSVKIRIPVKALDDNEKECGELLFKKEPERVKKAYPPDSKTKYALEEYSAADHHAQIYSIEIHGEDEDEVFEFRPKHGKCTIEIYYALKEELPVKYEGKWLEKGGEGDPKESHEHE